MKATELISALQALLAKHGDLDVRVHNEFAGEFEDANEVLARRVLSGKLMGTVGEVFFGIDYTVVGDRAAQLRNDMEAERALCGVSLAGPGALS